MSKHFTHLHLHTDHSLLDGAITIEKLVDFGKNNNFKSLAISDHGNIFAAVKFFQHATKSGIKPIIGMEAYFTENALIKDIQNKYYHLILLVQNEIGYINLCKLIAFSFHKGFYFKPRIDYEVLKAHNEGLIVTSACLGGHIPSLLMSNQEEVAVEKIDWFLNVFGNDRFYLEVQPDDQKDQKILNEKLFDLSIKKGVRLVATGDCHYVSKDDREAHEVMLAIQTHNKITDSDRFTFGDCRVHMRTESEMLSVFPNHSDAIYNTGKIADMCNFEFRTGNLFFPNFEIPIEYTQDVYFTKLCKDGLENLFESGRIPIALKSEYESRLLLEIDLIIKMGFVCYFLVVSDFIRWAKINDIPVGPGRGSVVGSLVAWALLITDLDPIKYNLFFERFLNPERVSMPDIDIDFCIEGRDAVINYVKDKYGHDKVCQIITFGTMLAKGVIKDVARVLGFPFEDSNALTELIPDQLKITLKEALEQEPKLKELISNNPNIARLFDLAQRLEGITRHASKHAAGIVISPDVISNVLPVYIPAKTNDLVTQYTMTELEYLGYLKMDFLGLKNLTLVKRVLNLIKQNYNLNLDISRIQLDDLKTFELLCKGETSGVFQLESNGIKDVLRRLQPVVFEDIIAVNALYRPGPLGSGMVDDFIERKHGRQKIDYFFPELESVLKETYGVIVYQEQVMQIAAIIAGYSLGEADILRRAMGKKKADVMAEQRAIFVNKALLNGFDDKKSGELFDLIIYFAGYGFNKAHSAAYALIAYQTAYLKSNFPAEFMACLISLEASDGDQMAFYIQESKDMKLALLPPDINLSYIDFIVCDGKIRFGLRGIKNVGHAALESIIKERESGCFIDLLDFCKRVDLRVCNKRVIESLICSGAFDSLVGNRAQKFDELEKIMSIACDKKMAAKTGQMGLFDILTAANINKDSSVNNNIYSFIPKPDWDNAVKLEKEKEIVGVYISAQPLDEYRSHLRWSKMQDFKDLISKGEGTIILSGGLLKTSKSVTTKKGDRMAFLQLEDYSGRAEIIVFPKLYVNVESWLATYKVFAVKGILDTSNGSLAKIKAQAIVPLDLMFEHWACQSVSLGIFNEFSDDILLELKNMFVKGTTPLEFLLNENGQMIKIITREKVRVDAEILKKIEAYGIDIIINL